MVKCCHDLKCTPFKSHFGMERRPVSTCKTYNAHWMLKVGRLISPNTSVTSVSFIIAKLMHPWCDSKGVGSNLYSLPYLQQLIPALYPEEPGACSQDYCHSIAVSPFRKEPWGHIPCQTSNWSDNVLPGVDSSMYVAPIGQFIARSLRVYNFWTMATISPILRDHTNS